jgi:hypothetical protein
LLLLLCALVSFVLGFPGTAISGSFDFLRQFVDPQDGHFDMGAFLAGKRGFLPVPLIITEPAVGYGGGLAVAYFHDRERSNGVRTDGASDSAAAQGGLPPSITAVLGAATENGSWIGGAVHQGIWRNDSIRYLGVLGVASINLQFYGIGDDSALDDNPEQYNIGGAFLLQELRFRLPESNFFAGARYQFLGSAVDFDSVPDIDIGGGSDAGLDDDPLPGVRKGDLDSSVGQLGFLLGYDSRDNIFSPNAGIKADFEAMFAEDFLGSDFRFQKYRLSFLGYTPVTKWLDLGVRLDGRLARGDTPFYALPFIEMRGIPAMRYQDNVVALAEVQGNLRLTPRWTLTGFGGIGKESETLDDLGKRNARTTVGGGFRYLLARDLGLRVGIDVARGPEEWAFYLQVGSAWMR